MVNRHKANPIVYKLTSPDGKAYIGQTRWKAQRWFFHKSGKSLKSEKSGGPPIAKAIAQYGWKAFVKEVIKDGISTDDLDYWEKEMIKKHGTLVPNGYNVLSGGGVPSTRVPSNGFGPPVPRPKETVDKMKATWDEMREERLKDVAPDKAQKARLDAAQQSKHRREVRAGEGFDGRFGPSERRNATWDRKREARLANMSPEEADKERRKAASNAKWLQKKLQQAKVVQSEVQNGVREA
jgi:group I intron endonuclease